MSIKSSQRVSFFERQDNARAKTKVLVFYFLFALFLTSLTVGLLVSYAFYYSSDALEGVLFENYIFANNHFFGAFGLTAFVITLGSLYKINNLKSHGGADVARSLGGRQILSGSTDLYERRLYNVVEEMAIASGVPVPEVYVMDNEKGINAFAAGFTINDSVVAVTRGTLENLTRDELQGVVAHEFSHIFNGDTSINLKLMGGVHGLLLLSLIGEMILRSMRGSSRGSGKKGGGALPILIVGLGLFVIGYIGYFFTRIIKSAISRQREYLADASAVQFTRNPGGIAGALKKIAWESSNGLRGLESGKRSEVSHMLFSSFGSWFSSHPPLPDRIRAIDPNYRGDEVPSVPVEVENESVVSQMTSTRPNSVSRKIENRAGVISEDSVMVAAEVLAGLSPELKNALREKDLAKMAIIAVMVSTQSEFEKVRSQFSDEEQVAIDSLLSMMENSTSFRLMPLLNIALPALRQMGVAEYKEFRLRLERIAMMDTVVSVREYSAIKLIERHLDRYFRLKPQRPGTTTSLAKVADAMSVPLRFLSFASSNGDAAKAAKVFAAAAVDLPFAISWKDFSPKYKELSAALDVLEGSSGNAKKLFLNSCQSAIQEDGMTSQDEETILLMFAQWINVPVAMV